MKKIIYLMMFVLLSSSIFSAEINNFNNDLTIENLTFTDSNNEIIRYLELPQFFDVTSSNISIKPYKVPTYRTVSGTEERSIINNGCDIEVAFEDNEYTLISTVSCTGFYQMNNSFLADAYSESVGYLLSFPEFGTNNMTICAYNYDASSYDCINYDTTYNGLRVEIDVNDSHINSSGHRKILRQYNVTTSGSKQMEFGDLYEFDNSTPRNFSINIGENDAEYEFNITELNESKDIDLDFISYCDCTDCSIVDGFCKVPYYFNSLYAGIMQYSDLNVLYSGIIINSTITEPEIVKLGSNTSFKVNITTFDASIETMNFSLSYITGDEVINNLSDSCTYQENISSNTVCDGSTSSCAVSTVPWLESQIFWVYENVSLTANVNFINWTTYGYTDGGNKVNIHFKNRTGEWEFVDFVSGFAGIHNTTILIDRKNLFNNDILEMKNEWSVANVMSSYTNANYCEGLYTFIDGHYSNVAGSNISNSWESDKSLINKTGNYFYSHYLPYGYDEKYWFIVTDDISISPSSIVQIKQASEEYKFNITFQTNSDNVSYNISYDEGLGVNFTLTGDGVVYGEDNFSKEITIIIDENASNGQYNSSISVIRLIDNYTHTFDLNITISTQFGQVELINNENIGITISETESYSKQLQFNNTGSYNLTNITCILNGDFTGKSFWSFEQIDSLEPNFIDNLSMTIVSAPPSTYTGDLQCFGFATITGQLDYIDAFPIYSLTSTPYIPPATTGGGGGGVVIDDSQVILNFDGLQSYSFLVLTQASSDEKTIVVKNEGTKDFSGSIKIIGDIEPYISASLCDINLNDCVTGLISIKQGETKILKIKRSPLTLGFFDNVEGQVGLIETDGTNHTINLIIERLNIIVISGLVVFLGLIFIILSRVK